MENITHATLRVIDLPAQAGRLGLITLDNGDRRPVTLGPTGLTELSAALEEAISAGVDAVGVTGVGAVFCAGADLSLFAAVSRRDDVLAFARLGHRVLGQLAELPVPSFAFVNGVALGGGLELALHCTFRTTASSAGPIGLPEVGLGIVPGWGGTWLLPNLIGIEAARRVIVDAPIGASRPIPVDELAAARAIDVVLPGTGFLERSLAWAGAVLRGDVVVDRPDVDRDEQMWRTTIERSRAAVKVRRHDSASAATRALTLLSSARTASRLDGFAAEDDAIADLVMTDEHRAALYAFELTRVLTKHPVGAPRADLARPVHSVGVVGAGLMASQLAIVFATRLAVPVVLTDIDQERVDKGLGWIRARLASLVTKRALTKAEADRLASLVSGSVDKSALGGADLVIEAVFEDLGLKQAMLVELEPIVAPDCVIATNTSSLSLAAMAGVLHYPGRFVGMHFFNPVSRMALLEVIPSATTDDVTLATAFAVGAQLGKTCLLVQDAPGFAVNRVLGRMFADLLAAVDEGTPLLVADQALDPLGLPMSPLALLDLIGPAVLLHLTETLAAAWPERFPISANLVAVVESGARSVLTPGQPDHVVPEVQDLLRQGSTPSAAAAVLSRVRRGLDDEVARMLDTGVIASAQVLDTAMLLGAGWPAHLGGITPWLDRSRTETGGRRYLPPGVASVPS